MKEATGEANLTVITILLIGTILPVFYLVVPRMLDSMEDKSCCIQNNGTVENNKCVIYQTIDKKTTLQENLRGFRSYCN